MTRQRSIFFSVLSSKYFTWNIIKTFDEMQPEPYQILIIIPRQNLSCSIGREETMNPLEACWDRLYWLNNHGHIIMALDDPYHTWSAPIFDVPDRQSLKIVKIQKIKVINFYTVLYIYIYVCIYMTWRSMTLRGLKTKQSGAYPSLRPHREVGSTSIVKA